MPIGFISPEKAYDTIPRKMAEATLGGWDPRGGGQDDRRDI